jgi:glycosyltransferase involved in cell wall biosynthesis
MEDTRVPSLIVPATLSPPAKPGGSQLMADPVISDEPILLVTDQHPRSGIGTYAAALRDLLSGPFPNVKLVSLYYFDDRTGEGDGAIRLVDRPARNALDGFFTLKRAEHRLRTYGFPKDACVHLCGANYEMTNVSTRTIATVHDYYLRRPSTGLLSSPRMAMSEALSFVQHFRLPRQLRRCRAVVSISETTGRDLKESAGVGSTVIPHWTDPARFHPRDQADARRRLGLPQDAVLLLNFGAAHLTKNPTLLAAIVRSLPERYLLLKIGAPIRASSARITHIPELSSDQYPLCFNAADAYVHASLKEGFGRPLLEAMASGLPVISTRTAGALEVLGDTELMVDSPYPVEQFVERILALERGSETERYRAAGLQRATHFAFSGALARYVRLYQSAFAL